MQIAVVHDNGLLGRVLLERLKKTSLRPSPVLVSRPELLEPKDAGACLPEKTEMVINTLQLYDPEVAEQDPERTRHLAFSLPLAFAEHARTKNMAMLQLSSAYIFDGRKQSAYISTNPGQPFSQLGCWQWECEQAIRALLPRHLILRSGWMLERFVRLLLQHCGDPEPVALSSRYRGQPVPLNDLARVITGVLQQVDCGAEVWGTYQYAAAEEISLYEMGLAIASHLEPECRVHLVDSQVPWMKLEPENATLGCIKIRNGFGIKQQPWRHALGEEIALIRSSLANEKIGA